MSTEDNPKSSAEPVKEKEYWMYHGTTRSAAWMIMKSGFKPSTGGMLGPGVYLSRSIDKALRYPLYAPESERVLLRVKVNVGRVIKIDHQGHPLQKTWHDHGYDAAWVPPHCGMVRSGLEEACVWDPKHVQLWKRNKLSRFNFRFEDLMDQILSKEMNDIECDVL